MAKPIEVIEATVGFDAGTSTGKITATWQSDEFPFDQIERHYLVPPAMRSLSQASYAKQFELGEDRVSAIDSCTLSYLVPGTNQRKYWEMGEGATRPGKIQVQERKFEKCLAKVLAFLGHLVQGEMKTTAPVELTLGLLLPLDEFGDRHLLADWLRAAVGSFEYNGTTIDNIKLVRIDIKPEGYGIYKGSEHLSAQVVNWGHADLSMLIFSNGKFVDKQSTTWPLAGMHGFMQCLDFPVTYELEAAQIISAAGRKMDGQILKQLTQTKTTAEMARLKKAITAARSEFWEERQEEFSSVDLDGHAVLLGGGTSYFFDVELNRFYEKRGKTPDWGEAVASEFAERFGIEADSYLPNLFKDLYGYFCTLPGVERFATKAVEVVRSA